MSFLNPSPKKSEELRVRKIRFLGEQDGSPERLMKEKLADFLRREGSVSMAYLAKVDFGEGKNTSVVLGLRRQFGPDKGSRVPHSFAFFADEWATDHAAGWMAHLYVFCKGGNSRRRWRF